MVSAAATDSRRRGPPGTIDCRRRLRTGPAAAQSRAGPVPLSRSLSAALSSGRAGRAPDWKLALTIGLAASRWGPFKNGARVYVWRNWISAGRPAGRSLGPALRTRSTHAQASQTGHRLGTGAGRLNFADFSLGRRWRGFAVDRARPLGRPIASGDTQEHTRARRHACWPQFSQGPRRH